MIVTLTRIIIVIAVIFVLFCPRQVHATTELDLVNKACDQTSYKDLCRSIALKTASTSTRPSKNIHDLAEVLLKAALTNATEIYNYINEILTKKIDPFVEQCLLECSDGYEDVMDQLDNSITALDSRAYDDIDSWVKSAVSDVELCDDGFTERRGHGSPLKAYNRLFHQLCSVVLSITRMLKEENNEL